jgi:hypothetical protein
VDNFCEVNELHHFFQRVSIEYSELGFFILFGDDKVEVIIDVGSYLFDGSIITEVIVI